MSSGSENTVELVYNFMMGAEYFVSLQTSFVVTEEHNVTVKSEKLIGTTKYLMLQARCRIN
jgi:hypothetical protein